jgi:transcriptional regulator with XRE-family HTH domain
MDATKIGRFIGAERRAKGWTQRQLADKLQLTDKAISRWETGKGLPDVSLLLPLANVLDITVGELLAGRLPCRRLKLRPALRVSW